jgi:hypothetical protein
VDNSPDPFDMELVGMDNEKDNSSLDPFLTKYYANEIYKKKICF